MSYPMDDVRLLCFVRLAIVSGEAAAIREAAMISQGELARGLGVSAACVSRWEGGGRQPKGEAGVRYARALADLKGLRVAYGDARAEAADDEIRENGLVAAGIENSWTGVP